MKLQKLFVISIGLLIIATGCQLSEPDSGSRNPAATTLSPGGAGSGGSGGTSGTPGRSSIEGLVISDPLTNGTSAGIVSGGTYTSEGYKVTTNSGGYVMYPTNIVGDIRVEFDAKGYLPSERAPDSKLTVIEMYDADPYTEWRIVWESVDSYLYQLRKRGYDPTGTVTDALDLKFGNARRGVGKELWGWRGDCLAGNPVEWNPGKTYHWVVIVENGRTEVYRDGQIYYSVDCATEFAPTKPIVVRIGGTSYGASGPRDVTYSNVQIYSLN